MLDSAQVKLLEVITAGAFGVAAIFFTVLAVLFASILTIPSRAEKRPLQYGSLATYAFVIASIALTGQALGALRYQTPGLYYATVAATMLIMVGVLVVATFIMHKAWYT